MTGCSIILTGLEASIGVTRSYLSRSFLCALVGCYTYLLVQYVQVERVVCVEWTIPEQLPEAESILQLLTLQHGGNILDVV